MALLKTSLHWIHRIFWYTVAALIITTAIAISLVRIFLPDVKVYRQHIEQVASVFLGQEVHIRSMDARLSGVTPMIIFRDVRLMDDAGKHEIVRFNEARLGLDLWRSVINRKVIPESFSVYGVNLGITRRKDHTLVLQGLDMSRFEQQFNASPEAIDTESNELAKWLFQRSSVSLRHSTIVWRDALRGNKTLRFDDVNFDIRNDGDRHQFTGAIMLPVSMGKSVDFAFDFHGNILNPAQWQGQFYTRASALKIANWGIKPAMLHSTLEEGVLGVQMWGQWNAGRVTAITADLNTEGFRLSIGQNKKSLRIKNLSGLFDWREQENGWKLNIDQLRYQGDASLWPQTRMYVGYQAGADKSSQLEAYSSYFDIHDVVRLMRELSVLDKTTEKRLEQISATGELSDCHVVYQRAENTAPQYTISTGFKGLSVKAFERFPGVEDVDGKLWTNQQHGEVRFADSSLQLSLPTLFREPFSITRLQGSLAWWHAYDAWHIHSSDLAFESKDVRTDLAMNLDLPDNKASPYLDLQADFADGDVQQTWRYLPVGIMDRQLVKWLDRSVVDGRVRQGQALFHGRLHDFPFTHAPGTFVVDFQLDNAFLDYQKGWPGITAKQLEARFTGKGMSISVPDAQLYQTQLQHTTVAINDFRLPVLDIHGKINGQADDAVRFLVESPIAPAARNFYRQSEISGGMSGEWNLSIALSRKAADLNPTRYKGFIQFNKASLQAWQQRLAVNNVSGRLDFSNAGVFAKNLHGQFSGHPIRFVITSRNTGPHQLVDVSMDGMLDMARLKSSFSLNGLEKRITGKTQWHGDLVFGSDQPDHQRDVSLKVTSRLSGLGSEFPAPLNKSPESEEAFELALDFIDQDRIPLQLKLGHRINAALLLQAPTDQRVRLEKGSIRFSDQNAELPQKNQLVIQGSIPNFPIDEWQAVQKQLADTDKVTSLNKTGLPVEFDLDYLNVKSGEESSESAAEDPRKAMLINGDVRKLEYDGVNLGHVTLKTSRQKDGIHFDKIILISPDLDLRGGGSWFIRDGKQQTNVLLTLKSDNVGNLISRLGYQGVIHQAKAEAVLQFNWDDAPNHFSLARLNGTLGTVINDGVISEVEPGAGRLLGLLSLSEIPRHLALDFSEFREGLKFKQIVGQFDIVDGDAFTQNLHIVSPIALIDIDGRTGLAKRDYDLDMSIAPNVSKTLPVISWLAWGGQVGALTFLMDQLFGKDFNKSIASSYRITGTWEKPVIKEIPRPKPQQESKP